MTEAEFRAAIAEEAKTWIGTPYHASGSVKGAGCNCAQFAFRVGRTSGAIPTSAPEPRWYTPQLSTHSKEERLISYIRSYGGVEIAEGEVKTGDLIAYKSGQSHGHVAIVLDWPIIIHLLPPHGCQMGTFNEGRLGAMARRYFTLWKEGR